MKHLAGTELDISTANTRGHVTYLTDQLLKIEREDYYAKSRLLIDAFGPSWLVLWFTESSNPVYIRNYKKFIEIPKNSILFIPPFSILQWAMPANTTRWQAYVPNVSLPNSAPQIPTFYSGQGDSLKPNIKDLIEFVTKTPSFLSIEPEKVKSPLAKRLKLYIDNQYKEGFRIQDLASQFRVSRVVLSRTFQRSYQLSPLQYRQRIRIFDALSHMNQGANVTKALFDSGFSGVSEFNRQFKNTLDTTPKAYSPLNRKIQSTRVSSSKEVFTKVEVTKPEVEDLV